MSHWLGNQRIEDIVKAYNHFSTPLGDLRTREFESFFNHQFSHIPPSEGITKLYFTTNQTNNTVLDRDASEARLHLDASTDESVSIETTERGHYTPGSISIPGIAFRLGHELSGEQEVRAGYFNGDNGIGVGEDSNGMFVFKLDDGTLNKTYQEDWNLDVLDGSGNQDNQSGLELNSFQMGNVIRIPFLAYNHGQFLFRIGVKTTYGVEFADVHVMSEEDNAFLNELNLPLRIVAENRGTAENLDAYLSAVHFERLSIETDQRQNGIVRLGQSLADADVWYPLISWRKRSGWQGINTRPQTVKVTSDEDLTIEIQLDSSLGTNASFSRPTHTSSGEVAVEGDKSATEIVTNGERRWVGYVKGGSGATKFSSELVSLRFNLPAEQIVTLAAKSEVAGASVDSKVLWSSDF